LRDIGRGRNEVNKKLSGDEKMLKFIRRKGEKEGR
jgi:hypothetical protein